MANIDSISNINIDLPFQTMVIYRSFFDNAFTPNRFRGMRVYVFKLQAGVIKVTDDTGSSLPDAQTGLKNAFTGGGANNGLIPEINSYFTTNAASIVL